MFNDLMKLMDYVVDFIFPRKDELLKLEQTYLPLFLDRKKRHIPKRIGAELDLELLLAMLHRNLDPDTMLRVVNKLLTKFKGHPKLKQVLSRWASKIKKQKKMAMKHKLMTPGIKLDDLALEALVKKLRQFIQREDAKLQKMDKKQLRHDMLKDQRFKMNMLMHFLIIDFARQQQALRQKQMIMLDEIRKAQERTARLQKQPLPHQTLGQFLAPGLQYLSPLDMILQYQAQIQLEHAQLEQRLLVEQQMLEQIILNAQIEQQQMNDMVQQHQLLYQAQLAELQYLERLRYQFQNIYRDLEQKLIDKNELDQSMLEQSLKALNDLLGQNAPQFDLNNILKINDQTSQLSIRNGFKNLYDDLFGDLQLDNTLSMDGLKKVGHVFKDIIQAFTLPAFKFSLSPFKLLGG